MSQSFERAKSRLANVEAIQPLLTALRTMSMGSWQAANKKITYLKEYEENLDRILAEVLPYISPKTERNLASTPATANLADTIFLIIGSERGLCGKFNTAIAENALSFIKQSGYDSYQIWVMGTRLMREIERKRVPISWQMALPASGLVTYQQSFDLTQNWLERYETFGFNQFIILHNRVALGGAYHFTWYSLLPYQVQRELNQQSHQKKTWPPAIIETDPKGIYRQIIQHFFAASFHQILLKSAAAEHSARYHLMQEASDNAADIIEELARVINAQRKRRITQEMQELAISAGLLDHQ